MNARRAHARTRRSDAWMGRRYRTVPAPSIPHGPGPESGTEGPWSVGQVSVRQRLIELELGSLLGSRFAASIPTRVVSGAYRFSPPDSHFHVMGTAHCSCPSLALAHRRNATGSSVRSSDTCTVSPACRFHSVNGTPRYEKPTARVCVLWSTSSPTSAKCAVRDSPPSVDTTETTTIIAKSSCRFGEQRHC